VEGLEDRQLMSVTVLHNPLGQGEDVRLEADGRLYLDRGSSHVLLDDHCRAVVAGVLANGQAAIFNLKNDSNNLYAYGGGRWQLMDNAAGQIAQGEMADGRPAVFDLKMGGGSLYSYSTSGWQLMDNGAGQIAQGVIPTHVPPGVMPAMRPAVFDLKKGGGNLYAYGMGGWRLLDNGAGQIASGVLADGRSALFDLKKGTSNLYAYSTAGWQLLDNGAARLSQGVTADGQPALFDLKTNGDLYAYTTAGWQLLNGNDKLTLPDGSVWFLGKATVDAAGDHPIDHFDGTGLHQLGYGVRLGGAEGTVYALNSANQVWRWGGSSWAVQPATAGAGKVFFLGAAGGADHPVHYFDGTGLHQLGYGVRLGAAEGTVYALNSANQVWRWNGQTWGLQSNSMAARGEVWFLGAANVDGGDDHAIYRFGPNGQLQLMPGSGTTLTVGGGTVWVSNAAQDTFSWGGSSWAMLPHAISARWLAMGGPTGSLGAPLGNALPAPGGYGQAVHFAKGVMHWSAAQGTTVVTSRDGSEASDQGLFLTGPPRISMVGNTIRVFGNQNDANDLYVNCVSVSRNTGDLVDNGITVQLTIYWVGGGLYLTTPGPWVYTKYFNTNSGDLASVTISGSNDNEAVVPAGVATSGFQAVQITGLPTGTPQTTNTCGPNSAWRVIQSYGGVATYQDLIDRASEGSVISRWGLGTTGQTLVDAMNTNRRGFNVPVFGLQTHQGAQDVINLLQQGKPVVAMIRVPGSETVGQIGGVIGGILGQIGLNGGYTLPALHWIAVNGYNVRTGTIYYTDTDGYQYTESVNDFVNSFNWDVGPIPNAALQAFGVVQGTLIA
jgi:hypothetical protein